MNDVYGMWYAICDMQFKVCRCLQHVVCHIRYAVWVVLQCPPPRAPLPPRLLRLLAQVVLLLVSHLCYHCYYYMVCGMRCAIWNMPSTICNLRKGICGMMYVVYGMSFVICNSRFAACSLPHAICTVGRITSTATTTTTITITTTTSTTVSVAPLLPLLLLYGMRHAVCHMGYAVDDMQFARWDRRY